MMQPVTKIQYTDRKGRKYSHPEVGQWIDDRWAISVLTQGGVQLEIQGRRKFCRRIW
jgi:hypothetical protein